MVTIGEESFYNADESGFNLKMHSGRTLSAVRTKTIVTTVHSLSSMTHSYTIMPTVIYIYICIRKWTTPSPYVVLTVKGT